MILILYTNGVKFGSLTSTSSKVNLRMHLAILTIMVRMYCNTLGGTLIDTAESHKNLHTDDDRYPIFDIGQCFKEWPDLLKLKVITLSMHAVGCLG